MSLLSWLTRLSLDSFVTLEAESKQSSSHVNYLTYSLKQINYKCNATQRTAGLAGVSILGHCVV